MPTEPTKKLTKTQRLEQQLQALQAEIIKLEEQCRELGRALDARDEKEKQFLARAEKIEAKHKALVASCQPFVKATGKWKHWPNDHIAAINPLTFGQIRAVREAAIANA